MKKLMMQSERWKIYSGTAFLLVRSFGCSLDELSLVTSYQARDGMNSGA